MNAETHLQLHATRSAELRHQADTFRPAPRAPRKDLRTRLGWTMVELGLRLIPNRPTLSARSPRTA
ncbi:hypothetical protein [Streptomyces sp. NBC_01618]|uniref:hypothetical protein n=1 Tax=Streptomyces sp. NBC_01618 TaxID=2975900 RepID=UPI003866C64E|nr:hypothetical protein OH735_13685 [Streptomyces sp. NBC_01618]